MLALFGGQHPCESRDANDGHSEQHRQEELVVDVVLYFTKGLKSTVATQLVKHVPSASICESADRFVIAKIDENDIERLLERLRLVDDFRLLLAGEQILGDRNDLSTLLEEALSAMPQQMIERARLNGTSVTFSTKTPFWEEQGWDARELVNALLPAPAAAAVQRLETDIRIQVDGRSAHISVSVWSQATKKSRRVKRPGALRSTVAAAMVAVAQQERPFARLESVYDPCCGSGTILVEALHAGASIWGSDIDPDAVNLTRSEVNALGRVSDRDQLSHRIFSHDLTKGWPKRVTAPVMISNVPWGKQIRIDRHQLLFDGLADLVDHTLTRGGVSVILTLEHSRLLSRVRKKHPSAAVGMYQLGLLGQSPWLIVIATKEHS